MTPIRLLVPAALLVLAASPAAPLAAQQSAGPVAARELPRGAVIRPGDVDGANASEAQAVLGWVTRRVVRAGEPLRAPAVAPPALVASGETVQLIWSAPGMELRMRGRAMGSAALGETVGVRLDVRRRFEGVVVGPGLVRMEPSRETR
jgi:flagellar basal body P-ring formation protein FlgA